MSLPRVYFFLEAIYTKRGRYQICLRGVEHLFVDSTKPLIIEKIPQKKKEAFDCEWKSSPAFSRDNILSNSNSKTAPRNKQTPLKILFQLTLFFASPWRKKSCATANPCFFSFNQVWDTECFRSLTATKHWYTFLIKSCPLHFRHWHERGSVRW